eukprot:CAMPEP_0197458620 /NCGR_PEP_ID=MMETSP1175-20131217/49186_1 /TAXON_ID=1003142 /ORGANISM="Triceratium dubium, Strain CCMP147" /LENGTH=72 /DNA_ID=CAMNT_0042993299 /DNA_START=137 /DNA_END=355 /DNA_ORIENTATION=-
MTDACPETDANAQEDFDIESVEVSIADNNDEESGANGGATNCWGVMKNNKGKLAIAGLLAGALVIGGQMSNI